MDPFDPLLTDDSGNATITTTITPSLSAQQDLADVFGTGDDSCCPNAQTKTQELRAPLASCEDISEDYSSHDRSSHADLSDDGEEGGGGGGRGGGFGEGGEGGGDCQANNTDTVSGAKTQSVQHAPSSNNGLISFDDDDNDDTFGVHTAALDKVRGRDDVTNDNSDVGSDAADDAYYGEPDLKVADEDDVKMADGDEAALAASATTSCEEIVSGKTTRTTDVFKSTKFVDVINEEGDRNSATLHGDDVMGTGVDVMCDVVPSVRHQGEMPVDVLGDQLLDLDVAGDTTRDGAAVVVPDLVMVSVIFFFSLCYLCVIVVAVIVGVVLLLLLLLFLLLLLLLLWWWCCCHCFK
jgi:hypothetical protein